MNTELLQKANSQFEQDFFKSLSNSIFGNVRRYRKEIKYIKNKIKKPNYLSSTIFTENFVAIQMKPEIIILDKPIYIGFTVLEVSKKHMYDFHYIVMKPFYGTNIKLCYTDTYSLLNSILLGMFTEISN